MGGWGDLPCGRRDEKTSLHWEWDGAPRRGQSWQKPWGWLANGLCVRPWAWSRSDRREQTREAVGAFGPPALGLDQQREPTKQNEGPPQRRGASRKHHGRGGESEGSGGP